MPYLDFTGKRFVQNYHLSVPHRKLEIDRKKSLTERPGLEDNIIIHGDNLEALKSLMPTFASRVKCVYIDPPYNTGNEQWVYNDKVNSPYHKDWLNGLGITSEDPSKHDKWLCMMLPRLKLLRELLSDDGFIFISIDDNEVHRLRQLLDDVFGEKNFVAELIVRSNPKGRVLQPNFATAHEYILCYSRSENDHPFEIQKTELQIEDEYPEIDDNGRFAWRELRNTHREFTPENRPNLADPLYADKMSGKVFIENAKGRIEIKPQFEDGTPGVWTWGKERVQRENTEIKAWEVNKRWKVYRKARVGRKKLQSLLLNPSYATERGVQSVEAIFGKRIFPNPKAPALLATILEATTEKDDIVLDSFAGSGTTAQAVLALNKNDGGARRFILVEQMDYADSITAERVRRVIKGVKSSKDEVLKNGYGGSFSYYQLGDPFDDEKFLSGEYLPKYKEMAAIVWSILTGNSVDAKGIQEKRQYVGETKDYEVYLIYAPSIERMKNDVALTLGWLKELPKWDGKKKRLVFAPVKWMSSDVLFEYGVEYVQLPYEIYRRIERPIANRS